MISNTGLVVDSGLLSPFSHIDHIPTYVSLKCVVPDNETTFLRVWDYKKMSIDLFVHLMNANWDEILDRDVNGATEMLTQTILEAAQQSIPQKDYKISKSR